MIKPQTPNSHTRQATGRKGICIMINQGTRTLTLRKIDILAIDTAITHIIIDFENEIIGPNTTENRKEVVEGALKMIRSIREEVRKQLHEQDEAD